MRARDTLGHRLYECPKSRHHWGRMPAEVRRRALSEAKEGSVLFLRGWTSEPQHEASHQQLRLQFEGTEVSTGDDITFDDTMALSDGPCYDMRVSMSTAGWTTVQLDQEGVPARGVLGNVAWPQDQTAAQAEHEGATQISLPMLCPDCRSAEVSATRGPRWAGHHTRPQAQAWRLGKHLDVVTWRKAHTVEPDRVICPDEWRTMSGNKWADVCAKHGACLHISPSQEIDNARRYELVKLLVAHAARVHPIWKEEDDADQAAYKQSAGDRVRERVSRTQLMHDWEARAQGWRCSYCARTWSATVNPICSRTNAPLDKPVAAAAHPELRGFLLEDGQTGVLCWRCGAWSTAKARALMKPCQGQPSRGTGLHSAWLRWRQLRWPANHRIRCTSMWPLDGGDPLVATQGSTTWIPPCNEKVIAENIAGVTERLRYKLRTGDPDVEPDGMEHVYEATEAAAVVEEPAEAAIEVARRCIRRLRGSGIAEVTADHLEDLLLTGEELLQLGLVLD